MENSQLAGEIECPACAIPNPGRYLMAKAKDDHDHPYCTPLFQASRLRGGFLTASPIPNYWLPGTELNLRGPFGKGFTLPPSARRIGLVSLDYMPSRLFGLLQMVQNSQAAVAVICRQPLEYNMLSRLPLAVEVFPIAELSRISEWADFIALDMALEQLAGLRTLFDLRPEERIACPAQALVYTPMPCSGLAGCGVCALKTRHGWELACEDGPVFNLHDLEW